MLAGDFFDFAPANEFGLGYDRAALIALPPEMRPRYLTHLASLLTPGETGLLVTLEYQQSSMQGPPFSVMQAELAGNRDLEFRCLERNEALAAHPGFEEKGLTSLNEVAYEVTRR